MFSVEKFWLQTFMHAFICAEVYHECLKLCIFLPLQKILMNAKSQENFRGFFPKSY